MFHGSPNPTQVGLTVIHPLLHGTNIIGKGGIWRAISSQIPGYDKGRQTTALCQSPIISTCIKHKMHASIRKNNFSLQSMSIYELPFLSLIPVPAITHIHVPAITHIPVLAITHILVVEASDPRRDWPSHPSSAPTSDEEKLTSSRRGPWHHHPSMATPRPPWARALKGLFTHSQCSESRSNRAV